jgi:methionyl-tRNA formyltransferase
MKIFILGRTEYLYGTAVQLTEKHDICGIITAGAMPEYSKNEDDFRELAVRLGCPYLFANSVTPEAIKLMSESKADICVSLNWKSVLKEDVISLFPFGILNAHFGDLPAYRGNAVINWAILNGEKKTTITIHQMSPGEIDSGDIWKKLDMPIDDNTTIGDITDFCIENTPKLFTEVIEGIENGTLKPVTQISTGIPPKRCYPRLPVYNKIDWSQSAARIHALIRASGKPYSGAFSYIKIDGELKKIYIWKSRIISDSTNDDGYPGHIIKNDQITGESLVFTGLGIIAITEAQYENEEVFQPGKKWKSIRLHFGMDIEEELIEVKKILKKITGK